MPPWLPRVLRYVRGRAAAGRLGFTGKALEEMAALGLSREDVREILAGLRAEDAAMRLRSSLTEEWMYEFHTGTTGLDIYVKVLLRQDVVVVSCHEDRPAEGPNSAG
jgi:hypothetical protein